MENRYYHLNPKTISCFVKDDTQYKGFNIQEKPFNVLDWISPYIIAEFGEELVSLAIGTLGLTFQDLITYQTIDNRDGRGKIGYQLNRILENNLTHHIGFTTTESKIDGGKHGTGQLITYTVYHLTIPSSLIDGDIIQFCLLEKYPVLKNFTRPDTERVQMMPIQTSSVTLKDLPEELRRLTVEEILAIKEPFVIEKQVSAVKCYQPHSSKGLEGYEFYIEIGDKDKRGNHRSLYVPYQALKQRDFSLIEKRVRSYWGDYYRNDPEELAAQLALLESPEAFELKAFLNKMAEGEKFLKNYLAD